LHVKCHETTGRSEFHMYCFPIRRQAVEMRKFILAYRIAVFRRKDGERRIHDFGSWLRLIPNSG